MRILKATIVFLLLASPCFGQTMKFPLSDATVNAGTIYGGNYSQLNDGATALAGGGIVGADGWPASLPKPTHWWNFANNYNDSASTNPLNLSAGGSGNAFGVDMFNRANQALVLNGAGYAEAANDPDLDNLGATFTILVEWKTGADVAASHYLATKYNGIDNKRQYGVYTNGGTVRLITSNNGTGAVTSNTAVVAVNTSYIVIATLDGAGNAIITLNGAEGAAKAGMPTPLNDATYKFTVGATGDNHGYGLIGSIDRVAIWKGTCLTPAQKATIYNAWVACDEANTWARWLAATPTLTKVLNGVSSSPSSDTWGAEAAGKYGYSAFGFRYHSATGDLPGSPGGWPQ